MHVTLALCRCGSVMSFRCAEPWSFWRMSPLENPRIMCCPSSRARKICVSSRADSLHNPKRTAADGARMLKAGIAGLFFQAVVEEAREVGLLSDEHFSVDGTLIEAWAIQKSFQRKDSNGEPGDSGNSSVDFHGEQRTNQTHESKTDPDARLYKKGKGKEAKL